MIAKLTSLLFFIGLAISSVAQVDQGLIDQFIEDFPGVYGISDSEVKALLGTAKYEPTIIEKISKPAEGTMTWARYRNIFLKEDRIKAGLDFWKENRATLNQVSEDSGVPEEIILGILGVETYFGQRKGNYKVLDALYTLGFGYPKRGRFFRSELEEFLVLAKKEELDIHEIKGSYAGAIGYCQFMPSSYRAYAVSFEPGGNRDLSNNVADAIASVANYLKVHRWKRNQPIVTGASTSEKTVKLKKQPLKPKYDAAYYINQGYLPKSNIGSDLKSTLIELEAQDGLAHWLGHENFYVITRYNHSALYAMAVIELGEAIKQRESEL